MPYCVTQEIGLQSCGWLAAYLGCALRCEKDLHFRNLGGTATLYEEIFPDAGTLTTRVRLSSVAESADTILLKYALQIWQQGRLAYGGETAFGFFTAATFSRQVGIRDAERRRFVPAEKRGDRFVLDTASPLHPDDPGSTPGPTAALPARALRMIDEVAPLLADGGPQGLGFARGIKHVDPGEWFFKAHFHQDPVCPGSLGLEAFLQLLKVLALRRWPALERTHRFEPVAIGTSHTWAYRGQIVPGNRRVEVEAAVHGIEDGDAPMVAANGFVRVDGTTIYELTHFATRLVPDE
jgi:3-hydroxymyristoyl/3-hydroxydecanoyl-(acyl carrier protein) dehydratase